MQDYSTKYYQTKINSTLKRLYTMTKWDSFLEHNDGVTWKTIIVIPCQQNKGKEPHDALDWCRKSIWQDSRPFYDKNSPNQWHKETTSIQ